MYIWACAKWIGLCFSVKHTNPLTARRVASHGRYAWQALCPMRPAARKLGRLRPGACTDASGIIYFGIGDFFCCFSKCRYAWFDKDKGPLRNDGFAWTAQQFSINVVLSRRRECTCQIWGPGTIWICKKKQCFVCTRCLSALHRQF